MGVNQIGKEQTLVHRHTASTAYFAIEGEGSTVVGDRTLAWGKNDAFVVPSWEWHRHANANPAEDAVLYAVSDAATLRKLALYREEGMTEDGDIVPVVD